LQALAKRGIREKAFRNEGDLVLENISEKVLIAVYTYKICR